MNLIVFGAPRTKKNSSRLVKVGKFHKIIPSEAYERWCASALPQLRIHWQGQPPIMTPVNVAAIFFRDALRGDAVGYYQGLADALQAAKVIIDDKFIVSWDGSRLSVDYDKPRIELDITFST